MCIADKHIKLCTCDNQISEDDYWELFRPDERKHMQVVGSFEIVKNSELISTDLLTAKIATDLNNHDCFDFEYKPQDGDVLEITVGGQTFSFEFRTAPQHPSERAEWVSAAWGLLLDQPIFKGDIETKHPLSL